MTIYTTSIYTDSSRAANNDHRLVVIGWKTPQKEVGNASYRKPPTICLSVPKITISVTPEVLATAMQEAFYDMQNALLRDLVSNKPAEQRVGLSFSDSDFDAAAVKAFMAGSATAGRLSKEKIESWFDSSVTDPLTLLLANRMALSNTPSSEELARLNKAIEQRKLLLTKIAGPGVPFNSDITKQLLKSIEPVEDSLIKQQVAAKLNSYVAQATNLEDLL